MGQETFRYAAQLHLFHSGLDALNEDLNLGLNNVKQDKKFHSALNQTLDGE